MLLLLFNQPDALAVGNYTINGQPASLVSSRVLECSPASYTIDGQPAEVVASRMLNCAAGNYSITGAPALGLFQNANVAVPAGFQPAIGGEDGKWLRPRYRRKKYVVPREVVEEPKQNYTLALKAGTYSLKGKRAGFRHDRVLRPFAGAYAISGARADGTLRNRTVRMSEEQRKRQIEMDNAFLLAS